MRLHKFTYVKLLACVWVLASSNEVLPAMRRIRHRTYMPSFISFLWWIIHVKWSSASLWFQEGWASTQCKLILVYMHVHQLNCWSVATNYFKVEFGQKEKASRLPRWFLAVRRAFRGMHLSELSRWDYALKRLVASRAAYLKSGYLEKHSTEWPLTRTVPKNFLCYSSK